MSTDDKASISRLNDVTIQNVKHENLRLLYVAAQVADIDLKISCALIQTMKVYRRELGTTSALGYVPGAARQSSGLPTINYTTIYEIVKSQRMGRSRPQCLCQRG